LAYWANQCDCYAALLSINEGDNELARFLSYIVAMLQTIDSNFVNSLVAVLQSSK
jgi:LuxR family maltose regulon positive regulatory protein